jgi:hypothetical protein
MPLRMSARDAASLQGKPKRSKYGAKRTEFDGIVFASKAEATRYQELRVLERKGLISDLELQPVFELAPAVKLDGKTKPALRYVADFRYCDKVHHGSVVEDVKGMQTQVFRIKRHLMKTVLGIEVKLVGAR